MLRALSQLAKPVPIALTLRRSHRDSKEIEAAMMDFGGSGEVTAAASESLESSLGLHLDDALDV